MEAEHARRRQQEEEARRQRRMEEERRRAEEDRRRREEQERRRLQEEQWRREQAASIQVRNVIHRMWYAKEDDIEALTGELKQALATEGPKCGEQQSKITEEAENAMQQAKERVDASIKEREDRERLHKEQQELKESLVTELSSLATSAEALIEKLKEEASPILENGDLSSKDIAAAMSGSVEGASSEAKAGCRACTDFLVGKRAQIEEVCSALRETKQELHPIQFRIHACLVAHAECTQAVKAVHKKTWRKEKATEALNKLDAMFKKYDVDGDGHWSAKEISAYAKGEFKFEVPAPVVEMVLMLHGVDGKGLPQGKLQRVRTAVGVARDEAKDKLRKEAAEKRRQEVEEKKTELQETLKELAEALDACDKEVAEAEDRGKQSAATESQKAEQSPSASELRAQAEEVEETADVAKSSIEKTRGMAAALAEGEVYQELQEYLQAEVRKLTGRAESLQRRLAEGPGAVALRLRGRADAAQAAEVKEFSADVMQTLRQHASQAGLPFSEVFSAADKDEDGELSEAEFLALLESVEGKPEKLDRDRVALAFEKLVGNGSGGLGKEALSKFVKVQYKVCKKTVLSDVFSIHDSKALRQLDEGELLDVYWVPKKDEATGIFRVHGCAQKDGLEGYASLADNQDGTKIIEECSETTKS